MNSKDTSKRCNRIQKRVLIQDKSIERRHVRSELADVRRSSGGYESSETDLSERPSNNVDGENFEITSNLHPRSKSLNERINERISAVYQPETDSIDSSSSPNHFGRGTESGLTCCVTTGSSSCVTNLEVIQSESKMTLSSGNENKIWMSPITCNEIRTPQNPIYDLSSSPSDLKMWSISRSAHVCSNHVAMPSPASHAEILHTRNALQENTPTGGDLTMGPEISSSIVSTDQCSSKDFRPTLLTLEGRTSEIDHLLMCSEWVKSLTDPDASFSPGACIHERILDRAKYSNCLADKSSIAKKAPESEICFIRTSSASEGICAELHVPTAGCVKVSAIEKLLLHTYTHSHSHSH